jgi:hypothetical protein
MKIDLKDFKKENNDKLVNASVVIKKSHKIFLESERINLSKLVRSIIDTLISDKKAKSG